MIFAVLDGFSKNDYLKMMVSGRKNRISSASFFFGHRPNVFYRVEKWDGRGVSCVKDSRLVENKEFH